MDYDDYMVCPRCGYKEANDFWDGDIHQKDNYCRKCGWGSYTIARKDRIKNKENMDNKIWFKLKKNGEPILRKLYDCAGYGVYSIITMTGKVKERYEFRKQVCMKDLPKIVSDYLIKFFQPEVDRNASYLHIWLDDKLLNFTPSQVRHHYAKKWKFKVKKGEPF